MAGQAVGAKNIELARSTTIAVWKIAVSVMGIAGLTFVLFPRAYLSIFTQDPVVLGLAAVCLAIVGLGEWLVATTEVFTGALRGAGDTRAAMLITLLGMWGVRIPLTYILIRELGVGLSAAWAVMVLDWAVRSLLSFLWFRSGRWERVKV
jgi:Na+-driven multidrug efflux pump